MCKKEDKQLVIYRNKVYDIAKFLPLHPGGKKIVEDHMGKPIDAPFDDEGHSDTAKKY